MVDSGSQYGEGGDPTASNTKLWKQFGRETDVGKMLFSLYSAPEKPKINYPAVKTRPRGESVGPPMEEKKCPQKTVIEYPEPQQKPRKKYHAIDFIPRRKGADEIQAEIEESQKHRRMMLPPGKKGVDRKGMINDLQERFQFKNKEELDAEIALRKEQAMLPDINQRMKKRWKHNGAVA